MVFIAQVNRAMGLLRQAAMFGGDSDDGAGGDDDMGAEDGASQNGAMSSQTCSAHHTWPDRASKQLLCQGQSIGDWPVETCTHRTVQPCSPCSLVFPPFVADGHAAAQVVAHLAMCKQVSLLIRLSLYNRHADPQTGTMMAWTRDPRSALTTATRTRR